MKILLQITTNNVTILTYLHKDIQIYNIHNLKPNIVYDAPPHSWKESNVSLKMKTTEDEGVGVHSLIRNTSKVKECVRASRWILGRGISESIIHTDLHKLNNKLVSAWLKHLWCTNESHVYTDSQNSPWLSQPHFGAKCENAIHIPESGKMESSGTPKKLRARLQGSNFLACECYWCHWKGLEV